jgi:hypothetical protein
MSSERLKQSCCWLQKKMLEKMSGFGCEKNHLRPNEPTANYGIAASEVSGAASSANLRGRFRSLGEPLALRRYLPAKPTWLEIVRTQLGSDFLRGVGGGTRHHYETASQRIPWGLRIQLDDFAKIAMKINSLSNSDECYESFEAFLNTFSNCSNMLKKVCKIFITDVWFLLKYRKTNLMVSSIKFMIVCYLS